MEERGPEITDSDPKESSKRTYSAPRLSIYSTPRVSDFGSVKTLSLSGTSAGTEHSGQGNMNKKP
jgi:hypothetical protein